MAYFIRILATTKANLPVSAVAVTVHAACERLSTTINYSTETETSEDWYCIEVSKSKQKIAIIERTTGEEVQKTLQEFKEDISDAKPRLAVRWLTEYLDDVIEVYTFEIFKTAYEDDNIDIINSLKNYIWQNCRCIIQADNEGFTNEEGYQITWQFSEDVSGKWACAVLNSSNTWDNFIMDLGDEAQREEFCKGMIPRNAKLL